MPLAGDKWVEFFQLHSFIFLFLHECVESVDDILLTRSVRQDAYDKDENTAEKCEHHFWTTKNAAMPSRQGSITL